MAEEEKKEEEKKLTKKDKVDALSKFFGFEAPFQKWTDDEIDTFIADISDFDKMCLLFFNKSKTRGNLFRMIRRVRWREGLNILSDALESETPILDFVQGVTGRELL